jgi:hypothetical protein
MNDGTIRSVYPPFSEDWRERIIAVELNRFAVDWRPHESDVIQGLDCSFSSFLSASLF